MGRGRRCAPRRRARVGPGVCGARGARSPTHFEHNVALPSGTLCHDRSARAAGAVEHSGAARSQDLVFVVREAPDERFRREGDDLLLRVRVPLATALSEGKVDVPALDGRTLRVPLKEARARPASRSAAARSPGGGACPCVCRVSGAGRMLRIECMRGHTCRLKDMPCGRALPSDSSMPVPPRRTMGACPQRSRGPPSPRPD